MGDAEEAAPEAEAAPEETAAAEEEEDEDDDYYAQYGLGLGYGDYSEGGGEGKGKKRVQIVLEEDSSKFKPQFYTFRRPDIKPVARGPPFWVLTDHLIAVVWYLFKTPPSDEPIGIAQLQWALEFLRSIRDDTGEYPTYVFLCIQQLEDRLLDLYASVPTFTEEDYDEEDEEPVPRGREEEPQEAVEDEEEGEGEEDEEGDDEEEKAEGDEGGEEEGGGGGGETEEGEAEEGGGGGGGGGGGEEDEEEDEDEDEDEEDEEYEGGGRQSFGNLKEVDRASVTTKRVSERIKVPDQHREMLSSCTLRDIMSKAPKAPRNEVEVKELFMTQKTSGPSVRSSPYSSQTKIGSSGMIPGAGRGDMLRFLGALRKEQTDRISIELKQLEKIDEFMKDVQTGNCNMGESAIKSLYDR